MKKLFAIFFFALALQVTAQVPGTLSYQGILTDASGNPVADGTSVITLNFYSAATGGAAVQTRGPINVTTSKGLFTTVIGDGTANNTALPGTLFNSEFWIGITVGVGGTELTPRVRMTAVPYSYRAQVANTIDAAATVAGSQVSTGINASNITIGTLPTAVLPANTGVPIGTIVAFGGTTIPTGWELCDGRSLSTTGTYAALFAVIQSQWGSSGGGFFNLPDLRGRFLRGVNGTATSPIVDPDYLARTNIAGTVLSNALSNNVGSYQNDNFKTHTHDYNIPNIGIIINYGGQDNVRSSVNTVNQTSSTGGNETRPKNAYVIYIIKAQ